MSDAAAPPQPPPRSRRARAILGRVPATMGVVLLVVLVGLVGQGFWRPVADEPWFDAIAYGLPALEAGRWWTPITGTFFIAHPLIALATLPSFAGMAFLEWRRGSRVALGYFGVGQLFAVFATAAFLMIARVFPWPWAHELAQSLDVGPSGGTMACIAAAVGLLAAPWRQRAWIVVVTYAAMGMLFLGTVADLEHAFAIVLILAVQRSFRIQLTTIREQRLLAMTVLIALGALQVVTVLIPTRGPFGDTAPLDGPWLDVAIDVVIVFLLARGLRLGRRWAWLLMVAWSSLSVLTGALLAAILPLADSEGFVDVIGDVDVTIASSVLWLGFLVYLVVTRRAFRVRARRGLDGHLSSRRGNSANAPDAEEVREIIRADGGGTLSWMATWEGMSYFRTSTGVVPFQARSGVAIALADPLGPVDGRARSVAEFAAAAESQGLIPCFFSASTASKDATPPGWRALVVADDTIVDLAGLAFTGKAWSQVRQALNRGEREGLTFRLTRLSEQPWGVRQQLRAISESWVGDKGLPEMRFTLGTLEEAEDPEVRVALAIAQNGDVEGFLSWLPIYGPGGHVRGWTLDLMRRRDGGFGPVMEFLIGSSARAFAEEGAEIASLSGAPLAHESDDIGVVARLLATLGATLEPVYGFRSLHRFKTKFNPRYEPVYLLYRDEGDLARIAQGLTRAFLPDATLRQFAAAGIDLLRRD